MKVVALTRTSSIGPSTRYRIEQYIPALSKEGMDAMSEKFKEMGGEIYLDEDKVEAAE